MNESTKNMDSSDSEASSGSNRGELLEFQWGTLAIEEIRAILDSIPLDLNFVDSDDVVQYYNESEGKVHKRKSEVIGNHVLLCHSEASRSKVEKMLEDFRSGRKDATDSQGMANGRPARWRYRSLHDPQGVYLGSLCITNYLDT